MKIKKSAYTLAELLVAISMLIIVAGLTIPVIKRLLPDSDQNKIKHVYYQLVSDINSMVSDPYLYPTGRFDRPRDYYKKEEGKEASVPTFKKDEKFTQGFISRLNILKSWDLSPSQELNSEVTPQQTWNRIFSYEDDEALEALNIGDDNKRTCVLTNNRVYFCLPYRSQFGENIKITNPTTGAEETMTATNVDRFDDGGVVVIKVYLTDDHSIEKGYYFTVNSAGKVGILSSSAVTCLDYASAATGGTNSDCTCSKQKVYDKYNQCKLDEYLMYN